MHKKIKQRFSLSHSTTETTPEPRAPMQSYDYNHRHDANENNKSHTSNQTKPSRHKKKKSLVETFKNFPPFHGTKHSENKQKITDLTMPKHKKSLSFSYNNNTKNVSLLPNTKKRHTQKNHKHRKHHKQSRSNRSNSVHAASAIAEEEKIDFGEDFSADEHDHDMANSSQSSMQSSFSFSPSPKGTRTHSPGLRKAKSTIVHSPFIISPKYSPSQSRSPRTFVEHEKNTLIEQMRQLQSSMVQLGDMLRNQDKNLIAEKEKNEKITEQINNLADENINLRSELQRGRSQQQKLWQDLEFYKLAARSRRDKNLILSNQLHVMETQKAATDAYSKQLLQQLNSEKEKNKSLTIRIRKYSRNVKSLHKKTSSLSGLTKYQKHQLNDSPINMMSAISDPIGLSNPIAIDEISSTIGAENKENNNNNNNGNHILFEQKKKELQALEEQTLQILNQLQEETRILMGDTKHLSKRNKHRTNGKKRKNKNRHVKKTLSSDEERSNNKRMNEGLDNNMNNINNNVNSEMKDDNILITTKIKTKTKTKTKTKAIIHGSNIDITTSKIETKTKTKTKLKTVTVVKQDNMDNNSTESSVQMSKEGITNDIGTANDYRNPMNDKSHSNSSQEWDSDENITEINHNNVKKRKSIDLNDEKNKNEHDNEAHHIELNESEEDMEEDEYELFEDEIDLKQTNQQAKAEVKILKTADAPLSLLFAAFEKQMASEQTDSESENEKPICNNNNDKNNTEQTVSSLFENFNGFSSDENNDEATDALNSLWD